MTGAITPVGAAVASVLVESATTTPDPGAAAMAVVVQGVLSLALYVWMALALTALLRKAGEPAWKAWVPVINLWTLFVIGGRRGWWALVLVGLGTVATIVSVITIAGVGGAGLAGGDAASVLAALGVMLVVLGLVWLVYTIVAVVLHVLLLSGVGRGFGVGVGYTVLGLFLFPVWASILGWGGARWLGTPSNRRGPAPLTLTPPPPAPAASPFTLGSAQPSVASPSEAPPAPVAPLVDVPTSDAPLRDPAPAPSPVDAAASFAAAAPALAPAGANPWAPPAPPTAFPESLPEALPAVPAVPVVAAVPAVPAVSAASPVPPVVDDESAVDERTVLAARRTPLWQIGLPDGSRVPITADAVVLGRNPVAPSDTPHAQLVPVPDTTRTVSKTHAILRLSQSRWSVTDLASTNGVFLVRGDGAETEVVETSVVDGAFLIGDAMITVSES